MSELIWEDFALPYVAPVVAPPEPVLVLPGQLNVRGEWWHGRIPPPKLFKPLWYREKLRLQELEDR